MANGRKTGGRIAGTPNRRTAEVAEQLRALNCDPIEGMASIAMNAENATELRGRMFAELAQYIAPKRKAVETRHDGVCVQFLIDTQFRGEPPTGEVLTAPKLTK